MPDAGATTRGNYVRGIESREAIVSAAYEVFAERGFHGASTRVIAERCGLSTSGVLHHFKTREALLEAVMDRTFRPTMEWVGQEFARDRCILDVFVELADRLVHEPSPSRLMIVLSAASIDREHPAHQWYLQRYGILRTGFGVRLRLDQDRGLVRGDADPELVAAEMLAMIEGLFMQWLNDRDAVDPVAVTQGFVQRLRADHAPAA